MFICMIWFMLKRELVVDLHDSIFTAFFWCFFVVENLSSHSVLKKDYNIDGINDIWHVSWQVVSHLRLTYIPYTFIYNYVYPTFLTSTVHLDEFSYITYVCICFKRNFIVKNEIFVIILFEFCWMLSHLWTWITLIVYTTLKK